MRIVEPLQEAGLEEQLRLHAWLWLDGPAEREGVSAGRRASSRWR